ncbi:MAG: hypothetical protein WDW36_003200 [Sanguina aurantia]
MDAAACRAGLSGGDGALPDQAEEPPEPSVAGTTSHAVSTTSFHTPPNPPTWYSRLAASRRDILAVSIIYFVEGILDMASLANSYFLKDSLLLTPGMAGLALTVGQIPWEATPLLGLLTDAVPLCGYHRKAYLLFSGVLGSTCWVLLALLATAGSGGDLAGSIGAHSTSVAPCRWDPATHGTGMGTGNASFVHRGHHPVPQQQQRQRGGVPPAAPVEQVESRAAGAAPHPSNHSPIESGRRELTHGHSARHHPAPQQQTTAHTDKHMLGSSGPSQRASRRLLGTLSRLFLPPGQHNLSRSHTGEPPAPGSGSGSLHSTPSPRDSAPSQPAEHAHTGPLDAAGAPAPSQLGPAESAAGVGGSGGAGRVQGPPSWLAWVRAGMVFGVQMRCGLAVLAIFVSSACTAWTQVIADAVVVKLSQGQDQATASLYQVSSWVTYTSGAALSAYTTGAMLSASGPRNVFLLAACGLLLDGLCALLITEAPVRRHRRQRNSVSSPPCHEKQAQRAQQQHLQRQSQATVSRRSPSTLADHVSGSRERDDQAQQQQQQQQLQLQRQSHGSATTGTIASAGRLPAAGNGGERVQPQQQPQHLQRHSQSSSSSSTSAFADRLPAARDSDSRLQQPLHRQDRDDVFEIEISDARVPLLGCERLLAAHSRGSPRRRSSSSNHSSGAGPCSTTPQTAPAMQGILRLVWDTVRGPRIFGPALFVFLWQACPSPTTAMFFFQTEVLCFSPAFQEVVWLSGSLAAFSGVLLYQRYLVDKPIKMLLLWCALLGTALNATQLLLVSRLNVVIELSDKLFVLGDYAMLSTLGEVMMTPMLALSARVCPEGAEATLYATFYSILNLSTAISTGLGSALTSLFGVTSADFSHLTWLVLVCNVSMLLPLPLLLTLSGPDPDGGREARPGAATSAELDPSRSGSPRLQHPGVQREQVPLLGPRSVNLMEVWGIGGMSAADALPCGDSLGDGFGSLIEGSFVGQQGSVQGARHDGSSDDDSGLGARPSHASSTPHTSPTSHTPRSWEVEESPAAAVAPAAPALQLVVRSSSLAGMASVGGVGGAGVGVSPFARLARLLSSNRSVISLPVAAAIWVAQEEAVAADVHTFGHLDARPGPTSAAMERWCTSQSVVGGGEAAGRGGRNGVGMGRSRSHCGFAMGQARAGVSDEQRIGPSSQPRGRGTLGHSRSSVALR